jgi:drug/metabolite transporter (DMT)-like permease
MVMFPVVALILSAIFEDLEIDATVIIGTLLVLAGNVFVLNTRARRVRRTPRPRQLVLPTALRAMDVE